MAVVTQVERTFSGYVLTGDGLAPRLVGVADGTIV